MRSPYFEKYIGVHHEKKWRLKRMKMLPSYYFSQKLEPLPSASVIPIFFSLFSLGDSSPLYMIMAGGRGGGHHYSTSFFSSPHSKTTLWTHINCVLWQKKSTAAAVLEKLDFWSSLLYVLGLVCHVWSLGQRHKTFLWRLLPTPAHFLTARINQWLDAHCVCVSLPIV